MAHNKTKRKWRPDLGKAVACVEAIREAGPGARRSQITPHHCFIWHRTTEAVAKTSREQIYENHNNVRTPVHSGWKQDPASWTARPSGPRKVHPPPPSILRLAWMFWLSWVKPYPIMTFRLHVLGPMCRNPHKVCTVSSDTGRNRRDTKVSQNIHQHSA
ncbi:hypothetical protein NDU88_000757 [Pleurodeles waltl]|uniref:Uncharacterized protein n=1 Tax=Pleurodeles waltl TaxID=8319 RepID=A0AAV7WIH9_PLEWA|nr:hypothetical protein NDU88_000757 [Pleurodeles waltl]